MLQITDEPISPELVIGEVKREAYGAVVSFVGIVRGYQEGKRILYLEYDAYKEMAERKLKQVADEVRRRWEITQVAIIHRIGRLEVGETIVVIAVGAPHRKEAFEACRYAIDRLKEIVPIWKKEVWEGGEAWVQ
ncbi:MAG: molybdenum cofactor biosynthesis protein MoaE [Chloroflexi bacterium RBG_13_54_9]|nr:MAG: molybdenum cofactor biosynthesis protein MoaE [Chloroflexi bacterium RBG_13_54_9]